MKHGCLLKMNSDLDDQRLSSMQSTTSEFNDSKRELRQVRCCVHGRPCAIASRFSRVQEREEEVNRDLSSRSHNYSESPYENILKNSKSNSGDTISYGLLRKVERDTLDVPLSKWNLHTSRSSSSTFDLESITSLTESDREGVKSNEYELFLPRKVERHSLSGILDAPFISKVSRKFKSKESCSQYELIMRPMSYLTFREGSDVTLVKSKLSKEQSIQTARTGGSTEMTPSMGAYIGIMTEGQAEKHVSKPTSFKLYHKVNYKNLKILTSLFQMPNIRVFNDILPSLALYIVYHSEKGRIRNYRIKECRHRADCPEARSKLTPTVDFQVDYGDPFAPRFSTIDALVDYYNIYVHFQQENGKWVTDIFPDKSVKSSSTSSILTVQKYY
ncbi:unnamed protein product [Thelazia callipaeda]|uniref:SH2 domain-containing protein n=1 Tax=Thelazia callipaeda TaxID=103827 RepID=A0A0N5D8Q0_THECL|nr:unnamed protein product [Thelazia callipaeda]